MSDKTSAAIFGEVFALIDACITDPEQRKSLALKFWAMKENANCDFADYQMGADDVLLRLGLARRGVDPDYPNDGECVLYGPVTV